MNLFCCFKKHYWLLSLIFLSIFSNAQTYVVGTGTTSGQNIPIFISNSSFNGNRLACHRSITIYRDGTQVLNMPGGFPNTGNQTISSIGWQAANDCVYSGTLKIYIKQTTATSAGVEDWNTVTIAGATLVYNSSVTLTNTTGAYTGVTLQTPFVWDNTSNLQIAVEFNSSSYPGCTPIWFRSNDNSGNFISRFDTQVSCPSQLGNGASSNFANTQFNGILPLPTITSSGILTDVCFSANSQTTTMAYSATSNSPISYSIDWNSAANSAGLSDQANTPFSFLSGGGTLTGINISANVAAGSYSGVMTLTNAGGFTSTLPITLNILLAPTVSFTGGANSLCVGGTSTYTTSSSNASVVTYSILSGGATINSTTGAVNNVTSNFTVRATATGSCGITTADFVVTVTNTLGTPNFTAGASTLCVGGTSTYAATASGASNISYSIVSGGASINSTTGAVSNVTGNFTVRATATGSCGGPTTTDFVVSVTNALGSPNFTAGASTLCAGGTSTYTATASGASSISYSIVSGGASINSTTGAVSNVTGNFTVRATATGSCGGPTTADFVVTVTPNVGTPSFTAGASTLCIGGASTYTATAANSTGITYSILTGGATINANTGLVSNVTASFTVRATATGSCGGTTTANFSVTVTNTVGNPNFTAGASTLCAGGTSTYIATASGSSSISYSIVSGGASINSTTGVVSNVTGNFTVRATATGSCGGPTTNDFAVTITPALGIPIFSAGASTLCIGGASTYTATATNSTGITYSIVNGGATINSNSGLVSNVTGNFTVRATATGACGGPLTVDLSVTVNPATAITTQPATQTVCDGGSITFSTVATGQNLTYQWNFNNNPINGATGSTYTINPASGANNGNYSVIVTGVCGNVTSQTASLTVNAALSITQQPQTQSICENDTLTLSVITNVNAQYQWQLNGSDITGGTGADYTINGAVLAQAGTYSVNITSNCGNATSSQAQLTVVPNITNTINRTICNGSVFEFASQFLTESGTYIGYYPAFNGCDSIVTLNLSFTGPTASISLTNGVDLSSGVFTSYQWLFNGSTINGATGQTYTADANGNYSVIVTDANGCQDTSDVLLVTSVGIWTVSGDFNITIYPNPTKDNLFIKGLVQYDTKLAYKLFDITGRKLAENILVVSKGNINQHINIEQYRPGMYVLFMQSENGSILKSFKFIIN
jgi:hypothetical protein